MKEEGNNSNALKRTSDTVSVGRASASTTMFAMSSMNAGSVLRAGTLLAKRQKAHRGTRQGTAAAAATAKNSTAQQNGNTKSVAKPNLTA